MKDLKIGDRVEWIEPMHCVPHPEGRTDRNGVILPVFRDSLMTGVIVRAAFSDKCQVRPDGFTPPKGIDSYYDKTINLDQVKLIK